MTGSVDEKVYKKIFFRSDAFVTTCVGLFGADSGRFVQGIVDLSGNGYPGGDIVTWQFSASPYDATHFEHGITGPITLMSLVPRDRPCSRRWRHTDAIGCRTRGVILLQVLFGSSEPKRRRTTPRHSLTGLNFLLLDAHRVFVRFNFAPRSIGIHLSKLSAEQQDL